MLFSREDGDTKQMHDSTGPANFQTAETMILRCPAKPNSATNPDRVLALCPASNDFTTFLAPYAEHTSAAMEEANGVEIRV